MNETGRPLFRQRAPYALLAACLMAFVLLAYAVVAETALVRLDEALAQGLHEAAMPVTTVIFLIITALGSEAVAPVMAVVVVYLAIRRQWWEALILLGAYQGCGFLNYQLKATFARPRPVFLDPIATAGFYSFPSGHAMLSTVFYGLAAYLFLRQIKRRRIRISVILGTGLLVTLIGFSRMYLGVHYLSDVLGGFAAGGAWATMCALAMEGLRSRFRRSSQQQTDMR